jgi:hypothetical protein
MCFFVVPLIIQDQYHLVVTKSPSPNIYNIIIIISVGNLVATKLFDVKPQRKT